MAVDYTAWSETPDSNTTLDGFPVSDGNMTPGSVDKAIRTIMAAIKTLSLNVPSTAAFMPKAAGTFTGTQPIYTGEGGFWHHASASNLSGKISILPEGSANPVSPNNGDLIFFYTP